MYTASWIVKEHNAWYVICIIYLICKHLSLDAEDNILVQNECETQPECDGQLSGSFDNCDMLEENLHAKGLIRTDGVCSLQYIQLLKGQCKYAPHTDFSQDKVVVVVVAVLLNAQLYKNLLQCLKNCNRDHNSNVYQITHCWNLECMALALEIRSSLVLEENFSIDNEN